MSKLLEDVVLSIAIVLGLLIGLYLSYAVAQGDHYPPTLITFFLAIGVSALIYRFMGGFAGTTFQAGLLKLGGAAAFFAGMMILLGDRVRDEIKLYSSTEPYRSEIANLEKERDQSRQLASRLQNEIGEFRRRLTGGNCPSVHCTITDVKRMRPDDPFVLGIRNLVEGEEPPFVSVLREVPVKVVVVGGLGEAAAFTICQDTLDKLNEGVEAPDPNVELSRTPAGSSKVKVNARRVGRIGVDVCSASPREFDVQINCAVALRLFADRISNCAEAASLRGSIVSIGSLAD